MRLGAHIGIANGLSEAVGQGKAIGCEAIQIFSKSPHMWDGPPIAPDAAAGFRAAVAAERSFGTAVHNGYLVNLASPKVFLLRKSRKAFLDEIQRAELLGVDGLIFHPGAHVGSGPEAGLRTIAESVRKALEAVPDGRVRLLLENAAGQGTALCASFEELSTVLAAIDAPDRVGVALDTCHLFAFGNDFRTADGYGQLVERIDATIGTEAVRAFHLNDARAALGSHRDLHENIGKGEIGRDGFAHLVSDRRWATVPGYLEIPLDDRGYDRYAEDLAVLRSLVAPASRGKTPTRRASPPETGEVR
ncbi:MAG TPA: deoxyribonuclease IV [Thermoplasmata archaeon]|nr:deoxyribonuclease IV [Thermoplasmata archaeon]